MTLQNHSDRQVAEGRRMHRRSFLTFFAAATAIALSWVPRAFGETPNSWSVTGFGQFSCATYVQAMQSGRPDAVMNWNGINYPTEAGAYAQWVYGFVSGINALLPPGLGQLQMPDGNAAVYWIEKYCSEHPDQMLWTAASEFAKEHRNPNCLTYDNCAP